MGPAIPAAAIVGVTPSVLSAGGTALNLVGLLLTKNDRAPVGSVLRFSSQPDVANYFGLDSDEAELAANYFLGFNNSNMKPAAMLFSHYNEAAASAWMRGGPIGTMGIEALQSLSGEISVRIDGVEKSGEVDLATATSFSQAGDMISEELELDPPIEWDSVSGAFTIRSPTAGPAGSVSFAKGDLATSLALTYDRGAVQSMGAAPAAPATVMQKVAAQTQDWASFSTMFEPDADTKYAFAQWTARQNNRWLYVAWDTDIRVTQNDAPDSLGEKVRRGNMSGVCPVYSPDQGPQIASFVMGAVASIDFTEFEGRTTLAFRAQSGLQPDITDQTIADNLISHGYNFYGIWATANDLFTFCYPGSVGGDFRWVDSYVNQIWLNNQLQLALMVLLTNRKSIPYNQAGYSMVRSACLDPILQGLDFGAIRVGITLSQMQIAAVNADAGVRIDDVLRATGYYLQVRDALPQVRAARGSPPIKLWYTDGGSIQKIELASIMVQ